jgi:hypothetical protein
MNIDNHEFQTLIGAPNVHFISPKVQAQAALAEYSRALGQLFNQSVQMLLLAKNIAVTRQSDRKLAELLVSTREVCERLVACSRAANAVHNSGNLFRYLSHLLEKAGTVPSVETFYEIASLAEVLAEGFDAARVS